MTETVDELYSLLIPIAGARLIVPRVCVAEVTGLGQLRMLEQGPEWLLGKVGWKGREIPLVSFESACGQETPEIASRTRAVILHATAGLPGGFYSILSQGLPQLVRVSSNVIGPESGQDWPDDAPVICRVRMINEYPLVPDLERIEASLAESLTEWR
ncbi:MAG: chemotaxis protein CheW [Gammaproteobacteria bacterium]